MFKPTIKGHTLKIVEPKSRLFFILPLIIMLSTGFTFIIIDSYENHNKAISITFKVLFFLSLGFLYLKNLFIKTYRTLGVITLNYESIEIKTGKTQIYNLKDLNAIYYEINELAGSTHEFTLYVNNGIDNYISILTKNNELKFQVYIDSTSTEKILRKINNKIRKINS